MLGGLRPAVWLALVALLLFCFQSISLVSMPPVPSCEALQRIDGRLVKATILRRKGTDDADLSITTGSKTLDFYLQDVSPERDRIREMAAGAPVSVSYLPARSSTGPVLGQVWGLTANGLVVMSCEDRVRRAEFSRMLSRVFSAAAVLLFIAASVYGWRRSPGGPHL